MNNSIDNINLRRRRSKLVKSFSNASSNSNTTDEDVRSFVDVSTYMNKYEMDDLKEEIDTLRLKLQIANQEIDNLNSENQNLQIKLKKIEKQNLHLKSICNSPAGKFTNSLKKKVNHKVLNNKNNESTYNDGNILLENKETSQKDKINSNKIWQPKNVGKDKHIYLFGGKQFVNVSNKIEKLREKSINCLEKYRIESFVKPFATTEEILKCLKLYNFNDSDKLIISIGEHDIDPMKLLIELTTVLRLYKNNNIIIVGVKINKHLNENKLNYEVRNICRNFKNCRFINVPDNVYNISYKWQLCQKINNLINSIDYDEKYLNINKFRGTQYKTKTISDIKNKRKNIKESSKTNDIPKIGTIPYYFNKKEQIFDNDNQSFRDKKIKYQ